MNFRAIERGATYPLQAGDHFDILLPDGSLLNVELTADDFTIVRSNGMLAYTKPVSQHAKDNEDDPRETTGRN